MSRISSIIGRQRERRLSSFTLVELLTVIAIIAILAGLVLAAGGGVLKKAARSRAVSEIASMSNLLESYKVDNGVYPTFDMTQPYFNQDPSTPLGLYQLSSQVLFQNLTGKTNATDVPVPGVKSYATFSASQLGNPNAGTYIKDPFGFSYGYSTGDGTAANPPNNGVGFFDLWSTGGTTGYTKANPNYTNTWLENWK
jgi:prepilin-type N-terminal cleavage/methylation domain-containing protein